MRMSAGWRANVRRSSAGVSPERTATLICGTDKPRRVEACPIPTSGERRLRSTSVASALSGDTYSTRHAERSGSGAVVTSLSMAHRNADSVLPEPVGATTSVCCPDEIASQAPSWAAVGAVKLDRNHAAVAGENRSSTSAIALLSSGSTLSRATDSRPRCSCEKAVGHVSGGGPLPLNRHEEHHDLPPRPSAGPDGRPRGHRVRLRHLDVGGRNAARQPYGRQFLAGLTAPRAARRRGADEEAEPAIPAARGHAQPAVL